MPEQKRRDVHFDVPYGLASAAITTGLTVVATTGGSYHGCSLVAGSTAQASVYIYDNASATTGNIIDIIVVTQGKDAWIDRYIPVMAKNGLTVKATGEGLDGAIFFAPKG